MRLLLASSSFPPETGGPSRQALEIIEHLCKRKHKVAAVSISNPELECIVYDAKLTRRQSALGKLLRMAQIALATLQAIRDHRPTLIHVQVFGGPFSLIVSIVARLFGIPTVVKLTGERSFEMSREANLKATVRDDHSLRRKFLSLLDHWQILLANRIWVTSPVFRDKVFSKRQAPHSKLFLYPNFTDTSLFHQANREKRLNESPFIFLTVCRLRPWKGIAVAIEATAKLKGFNFIWNFIGDGSESFIESLKEQADRLGVSEKIRFIGPIHPLNVHKAYLQADCFVLPSLYEPFGIVLIEAMAAGLPVIASNTGGIPYALGSPPAGILVESGSSDSLAQAMQEIAASPALQVRYAQAGRSRAKRFDATEGVASLEYLYRWMLVRDSHTI